MIVIVFGKPASGKNYYVDNFISKDKIVIYEAHNFDFSNYRFFDDKDYFIIVQNLNLLNKNIKSKCDLYVFCEFHHFDGNEAYFVTKRRDLENIESLNNK